MIYGLVLQVLGSIDRLDKLSVSVSHETRLCRSIEYLLIVPQVPDLSFPFFLFTLLASDGRKAVQCTRGMITGSARSRTISLGIDCQRYNKEGGQANSEGPGTHLGYIVREEKPVDGGSRLSRRPPPRTSPVPDPRPPRRPKSAVPETPPRSAPEPPRVRFLTLR